MHLLSAKISKFWPIILLGLIEVALFARNFTPGTFLAGWDNALPGANLAQNLVRSIFGVWQEYRGLGLYDGMSHAATLIHTLLVGVLSLFLSVSLERYLVIFFLHLTGGLGIFFLLRFLFQLALQPAPVSDQANPSQIRLIAFVGSLFYLFNLTTIQMFFNPYEAFAFHFASLPWLTLTFLMYLSRGSRTYLWAFFLTALLATPQFFVPTILAPTFALLGFIAVGFLLLGKNSEPRFGVRIGRIVRAGMGFFLINAFWLIPFLYGLPNNAPIISQAKINQMSSEEAFLRNQAHGNLRDVLLLRGYSFDFEDFNQQGEITFLMNSWINFLGALPLPLAAWLVAGVFVLGTLAVGGKPKYPFNLFLLPLGFSFLLLANDVPGIEAVSAILRTKLPLFAQVFRYPFTKFGLLYSFSYTIFFTLGTYTMVQLLRRLSGKTVTQGVGVIFAGLILILALPAFGGNFISPNLRVRLPDEYFSLFRFMESGRHSSRVTYLPIPSYWSWKLYRFGLRGSGFVWFGLPQPLLDRAFDPWSNYNENYYWELSRAIYSKNPAAVSAVLDKYDVSYILLDENLRSTSHSRALYTEEIKELLAQIPTIKETARFGNLTVFAKVDIESREFITVKQNLPVVSPPYRWTDNDVAYREVGDYITQPTTNNPSTPLRASLQPTTFSYPFRSLFTKRAIDEREFRVKEEGDLLSVGSLSFATSAAILKEEALVFDTQKTQALKNTLAVKPCGLLKDGQATAAYLPEDGGFLRLVSTNERQCLSFYAGEQATEELGLSHRDSYLVAVESRHVSGRPLKLSLINQTARHTEIETYLPTAHNLLLTTNNQPPTTNNWVFTYFILPPLSPDGLGYTVYLTNDAIGRQQTINDIKRLSFYKLPYQELTSLRFPLTESFSLTTNNPSTRLRASLQPTLRSNSGQATYNFLVSHPNPAYYKINLQPFGSPSTKLRAGAQGKPTTLILNQAFDPGWKAYLIKSCQLSAVSCQLINFFNLTFPFLFGKEIKNHVLVNNWANGWLLPTEPTTLRLPFDKAQGRRSGQAYNPSTSLGVNLQPITLVLNQSFDPGWKAWQLTAASCKWLVVSCEWETRIKETLPLIFGKELSEHVLVNNWANGWIIKSDQSDQFTNTNPTNKCNNVTMKQCNNVTIVIFFLPQLLQWIGFALLPLPFLLILQRPR